MAKAFARLTLALASFALISFTAIAQERPAMLVSSAWLADHLQDPNLVLLHVGAKGEFETGHISGAQPVLYTADIAIPFQEGQLSLELLPVDQLKANFERLGISDNSRIVVYFGKNWVSPSTRVIFTLAYMGLGDRTSLLDGGMPAWIASGHSVTADVKQPSPGKLTPHPRPELVVDAAWVASRLHQPSISIIDAREAPAYRGDDPKLLANPNVVQGHIPSARSIPFETLITDTSFIKDQSELVSIFRDAGLKPGSQMVSYCWVGQRATVVWFTARMLGYDAHLYDGSWQDWSTRKDLPIEMPTAAKKDPPKN